MNEFLIELQGKLDEAKSKANVKADITKLQNELDKLKIQVEIDPKSLSNIVKQLESTLGQKIKIPNIAVDSKVGQQIGTNIGQNVVDGISKSSGKVNAEVQKIANQVNKIQLLSNGGIKNDYATQLAVLEGRFSRLGLKEDEISKKTLNVNTAFNDLKQRLSQPFDESNFQEIITLNDKLQKELIESQNELTRLGASIKMATDSSRLNNVNQMQKWADNNGKAMKKWGEQINGFISQMGDLNNPLTKLDSDDILREFKSIQAEAIRTGNVGMTTAEKFSNAWNKIGGWSLVTGAFAKIGQSGRKIYEAVVKVNSAMIELRKVSDASASEIKRYFDEAAKSAKDLGSSVSDVINATADFSRLGYSLPEASKLAKVATLYKNVGDGINIDEANSSLVSTMKAFNITAEDSISIIDKLNEVGNNFSISSGEIGEALKRSASSLSVAGNSLSESIGLITAGNTVVQDADMVGTALKTMSLRITSTSAELTELGEDTEFACETLSDYRDLVMGLTHNKVNILDDNDNYKSTFQILKEISNVWQDMNSMEQSSLMKALFGVRQANIGSSILENFDVAEKAMKSAEEAAGSALKEQEAYEEGVKYSLDRLEAVFQTFANHILNSNFLKGIINFGSGTIEVIDKVISKLGSLGTIGTIGGAIAGANGLG